MTRGRPALPLLIVPVAALAACGHAPRPLLERVTCGAEITLLCGDPDGKDSLLDLHGNGLALLDVDADGDLDLLLVDGTTRARLRAGRQVSHQLLLNTGVRDGAPRFECVPGETGLRMNGWPRGVAVGDVDRDGRPDVLIGGVGEDALFLNRTPAGGAVRFERRELPGHLTAHDWTTSVALADADGDGDLDAYLARYVDLDPDHPPSTGPQGEPCTWDGQPVPCGPQGLAHQPDVLLLGDGSGGFVDASEASGIRATASGGTLGVLFADLDDDGHPDLFLTHDTGPCRLLRNRGDGTFEDGALSDVTTAPDAGTRPGTAVDLGDWDRDGDFDLAVSGVLAAPLALLREDGGLLFREATPEALQAATRDTLAWGVHLADFDSDGWLDLYTSNGHLYAQADLPGTGTSWRQRCQLFLGAPGGTFGPDAFPDATPWPGRASVRGDLDGDGDLDLVTLTLDGLPRVDVNRTDAPGRQLLVTLQDPTGTPIGATLKLRFGDGARLGQVLSSSGFQSASDSRLHVAGTGPLRAAEVRWNGGTSEALDPAALDFGRQVVVRRGVGVASSRLLGADSVP